jgi:hypothetical protein
MRAVLACPVVCHGVPPRSVVLRCPRTHGGRRPGRSGGSADTVRTVGADRRRSITLGLRSRSALRRVRMRLYAARAAAWLPAPASAIMRQAARALVEGILACQAMQVLQHANVVALRASVFGVVGYESGVPSPELADQRARLQRVDISRRLSGPQGESLVIEAPRRCIDGRTVRKSGNRPTITDPVREADRLWRWLAARSTLHCPEAGWCRHSSCRISALPARSCS